MKHYCSYCGTIKLAAENYIAIIEYHNRWGLMKLERGETPLVAGDPEQTFESLYNTKEEAIKAAQKWAEDENISFEEYYF